jgi:hypothetical protein
MPAVATGHNAATKAPDDDHHAEQKRDSVEINRAVSLIKRDDTKSDHKTRAK